MSSPTPPRSEKNSDRAVPRRTVITAAAWSVPIIAAATALPLASASGTLPPATFWGTGATVSVVSGNTTKYTLEGTDANADPALLPSGSTVLIAPQPGVTITPVSVAGALVTVNGDGSVLYTIVANDVSLVDIRFRPIGPVGSGYSIVTTVPGIDPFTETIDVSLR